MTIYQNDKFVGLVCDDTELAIIYYESLKRQFYVKYFDFDGLNIPPFNILPKYDSIDELNVSNRPILYSITIGNFDRIYHVIAESVKQIVYFTQKMDGTIHYNIKNKSDLIYEKVFLNENLIFIETL